MFEDFYFNVELVNKNAIAPKRAHPKDAGMDVFSTISVRIKPCQDFVIPLGWRYEMSPGYVMIATNKSGRAIKDKLIVGADTLDSDYRGIAHVHLFNLGNSSVYIKYGEKISQFIIYPCWTGIPKIVDEINLVTSRGEGKFGSTGLK